MRQGQNNSKRSRGRGRKPQHSANRAYDSNGPDVKIRGNAAHICEKYQQLARDAISAGDRVTAENYYQHAEHYYRLLMATQQGQDGQQRQQTNLGYRPDEDEEGDTDFAPDGPQPRLSGQPWHQQNAGGQNGNGQFNGGQSGQRGGEPASSYDDEGDEAGDAAGSAEAEHRAENEQGEAPPRRRNNRRRRPRGEGPRADAAPAETSAD
ncbi:MAG: DUF4167 domain-containing protein [Pseudomonadota bacterium]|jgi:hypothetical protein